MKTPIVEFVESHLERQPQTRVSRTKLAQMAKAWQGDDPEFTSRQLYNWLRGRGYKELSSNGERYFLGLKERKHGRLTI